MDHRKDEEGSKWKKRRSSSSNTPKISSVMNHINLFKGKLFFFVEVIG